MFTVNGFKFAKTEKEFASTLFDTGSTCFGFYRERKNGIVLMDHQKTVVAFIAFDGSISFLVTAWKNENGKKLSACAKSFFKTRHSKLGTLCH